MSDAWAWPEFPPDVRRHPGGDSFRLAVGYPLGQDPLGQAMAVACDATCAELHGPQAPPGPELDQQLDALCRDYIFTTPATHPERVRWQESARYVDVDTEAWTALGGSITYEIARLEAPGAGLLRVETIATYLRFEADDVVVLLAGSESGNVDTTITEPFPFPVAANEQPLQWVWELAEMMLADTDGGPEWAEGVERARAVPATSALRAPWEDNRYAFGNSWGDHLQHTVPGRALVRLFVTLIHPTPNALAAVRVGGGLKGFSQLAGRRGAAVQNNTLRI